MNENEATKTTPTDELEASVLNNLVSCALGAMDKGPWRLFYSQDTDLLGVISDDFTHDVLLKVSGDFASKKQKKEYCNLLLERLNDAN